LANQHKIISFGRLEGIHVNIDGVNIVVKFEVIEIMDKNQPYQAFLGLD
jgi:hypothetical protein